MRYVQICDTPEMIEFGHKAVGRMITWFPNGDPEKGMWVRAVKMKGDALIMEGEV